MTELDAAIEFVIGKRQPVKRHNIQHLYEGLEKILWEKVPMKTCKLAYIIDTFFKFAIQNSLYNETKLKEGEDQRLQLIKDFALVCKL